MPVNPGPISYDLANNLSYTEQESRDNRRRLDGLPPQEAELIPVQITNGSGGLHAWTRRIWAGDGSRTADWIPTSGTVNGLDGATNTWAPARMPDGSTLTTFPTECWIRFITWTETTGPNYEVVTSASGTPVKVLKVQSGSTNAFGYPARVQTWNNTTGAVTDLSSTEVRVVDFNGEVLNPGDYVDVGLFLGKNAGNVDCYAGSVVRTTSSTGVTFVAGFSDWSGYFPVGSPNILPSTTIVTGGLSGNYLIQGSYFLRSSGSGNGPYMATLSFSTDDSSGTVSKYPFNNFGFPEYAVTLPPRVTGFGGYPLDTWVTITFATTFRFPITSNATRITATSQIWGTPGQNALPGPITGAIWRLGDI